MRQQDPMTILVAAMGESLAGREPSNAILQSEAAGQAALAGQKGREVELPAQIDADSKAVLEKSGVVFGAPVKGDDIFQHATIPSGWSIQRTDHSMWTKLCDEKGRERASIFYKAAFYDRSAYMSACSRFKIESYYRPDSDKIAVARVSDNGTVLFESEKFELITDTDRHGVYDRELRKEVSPRKLDVARQQCVDWLANNWPNWGDASAYWD